VVLSIMKIFKAFKKWNNKPKPPKMVPSQYHVDIQPDMTIPELARIVFNGLRFTNEWDRDRFYNSLPPESQRHIKKL